MRLIEILEQPTVLDNKHESLYRCYHVLNYISTMVVRGDSKETILEVIGLLRGFEGDVKKNKTTD